MFGDSIIAVRDQNEFAETVMKLLEEPNIIPSLKRRARLASLPYDWGAVAESILKKLKSAQAGTD
jgi:glycosyltransferase involved in cell wall biosynthesis